MTPRDLGWGPPGCSRGQLVRLVVPETPVPMLVRREVAFAFRRLIRWLDTERQRTGAPRLSSSGGYNFRPKRGREERYQRTGDEELLSEHSWGTAVDFNAATNPMQAVLRTDMPPGTDAKARSLGLSWGGTWRSTKDAMHFEVALGPEAFAELHGRPYLRAGATGVPVRKLQRRLGVPDTGEFDDTTEQALRTYQTARRLTCDGICGLVTWAALDEDSPLEGPDSEEDELNDIEKSQLTAVFRELTERRPNLIPGENGERGLQTLFETAQFAQLDAFCATHEARVIKAEVAELRAEVVRLRGELDAVRAQPATPVPAQAPPSA